jgi:hypothetical protein
MRACDFADEAAELYLRHVAPAIEEIREAVAANSYLRQLRGQTVERPDQFLEKAGALTLGMMGLADAPTVASVVVGATTTLISAAAVARREQANEAERIQRDRLFFLYATEAAL